VGHRAIPDAVAKRKIPNLLLESNPDRPAHRLVAIPDVHLVRIQICCGGFKITDAQMILLQSRGMCFFFLFFSFLFFFLHFVKSPPSRAEVKNTWSCTSVPPVCVHGVALFKHRISLWHIT